MIRVKKIAHAVYEMPDVDKQTEYYTEVLGLTLTDKDKEAAYLASTVDHHSVVLRKGAQAKCVRLGFQLAPDDDLDAFEKEVMEAARACSTATSATIPVVPRRCFLARSASAACCCAAALMMRWCRIAIS